MRSFVIAAALLLAACAQTDPSAALRAQLQPFVGKPLSAYLAATGDVPVSAYDTSDGLRNFVFQNSGIITSPPVYSRTLYVPPMTFSKQCNRTVAAHRISDVASADAWLIVSIEAAQGC